MRVAPGIPASLPLRHGPHTLSLARDRLHVCAIRFGAHPIATAFEVNRDFAQHCIGDSITHRTADRTGGFKREVPGCDMLSRAQRKGDRVCASRICCFFPPLLKVRAARTFRPAHAAGMQD